MVKWVKQLVSLQMHGFNPWPKQWVKGYGLASAAGEVAAEAQIQSLALEHSYAVGGAIKK